MQPPTRLLAVIALSILSSALPTHGAPDTPFATPACMAVVKAYANAMVDQASGKFGEMKAPLFGSCLDRKTLYFPAQRTTAPAGIREPDRVANGGSNPQHDQALYLLLYALTRATGDARYAKTADTSLGWFLTHTQSAKTGLYPWGEHMSWDVPAETWYCIHDRKHGTHEMFEVWQLTNRCMELAPANMPKFAWGLWEHQIADQKTGDFSRHADYLEHGPYTHNDYQRHGGFYIRIWSELYALTQDDRYLHPIEVMIGHYEKKRDPRTQIIAGGSSTPPAEGFTFASPVSTLSLMVSCFDSAARLPAPLSVRLKAFSLQEDETFLKLPHFPADQGEKKDRGFVLRVNAQDGKPWAGPLTERIKRDYTALWEPSYGNLSTADVALFVAERYRQNKDKRFLDLALHAATAYMAGDLPGNNVDLWPEVPANLINLMLFAHETTGDRCYLVRAQGVAEQAMKLFWDNGPLPRASTHCPQYETITGSPDLALALFHLHEALHPSSAK